VTVGRCTDTASHSTLSLFCLPSLRFGTSTLLPSSLSALGNYLDFIIRDFWLSRLEDHSNCNSEGTHPGSRWPPVELSHPIVIPCLSLPLSCRSGIKSLSTRILEVVSERYRNVTETRIHLDYPISLLFCPFPTIYSISSITK